MLKILGRKTSSNVQKVLWCCSEVIIPFEREDIGGPFGKNNTPEYLARNPNGLVPTIDDDGFILWESNAIVRYLCVKHGAGKLWPSDLARRADADRWMDWQQTTLAPPMGVLFRSLLRQPPEVIDADQVNGAMQKATAAMRILDAQLALHSFVAGDTLTMGDIALGNAAHRWFTLPRERPDLLHVAQWYARLNDRPGYRQHIATV